MSPDAPSLRVLVPGDEPALDTFLRRHAATSLFLRANVAEAGLVDRGERLQATYVAAFEGTAIVSVAAHCWNGLLLLQAPERLEDVAQEAVRRSGRPLRGFLGPWEQVAAARRTTGTEGPARRELPEDLFELELAQLRVPAAVLEGRVIVRRLLPEDLDDFAALQAAYSAEALGSEPGPQLLASERAEAERAAAAGTAFVALDSGRRVAACTFNARLPDCVQVGGVYTPPELRGRGLARAVVGGALAVARDEGVPLAVLFTDVANEPARRAYLALGFRIIGDYGIVLLA